jgi:hypothetical protein
MSFAVLWQQVFQVVVYVLSAVRCTALSTYIWLIKRAFVGKKNFEKTINFELHTVDDR